MAVATYLIEHRNERFIPSNELPTVNPINSAYLEQGAVLGIMNNYGSDCILRIRELSVNEYFARTTTALTPTTLEKITAIVGGVPLTPIKRDSAASSLPSQVILVKYPVSLTSTGEILRKFSSYSANDFTFNSLNSIGRGSGLRGCGLSEAAIYNSTDANTQVYVLREGQGLAIRTLGAYKEPCQKELMIQFTDGTNTFEISEIITISSIYDMFAMLNGAGSGQVLYVTKIEIRQIYHALSYKTYNIETCSGLYGGADVTIIPMDSASAALDTKLSFKQNCSVRQGNIDANDGRNARAGGDMLPFRRLGLCGFGISPALANGAATILPKIEKDYTIDKVNNAGEIVLREGEGLAIFSRYIMSGFGEYTISALINVEDNGGTVSGGETSYVF